MAAWASWSVIGCQPSASLSSSDQTPFGSFHSSQRTISSRLPSSRIACCISGFAKFSSRRHFLIGSPTEGRVEFELYCFLHPLSQKAKQFRFVSVLWSGVFDIREDLVFRIRWKTATPFQE